MKRQFRKLAGRWVRPFAPEFLRQAWGRPLYGYRPTTSCFRLESHDGSGTLSFIDDETRVDLRLPEDTRASICRWVDINGKMREEWQALMREARCHRTLFDIGSFDGTEALLFCAMNPSNRAFVFEPSPSPMRGFRDMADANGISARVSVRQVAIGGENGRRPMYLGTGDMLEIVEMAGLPDRKHEPAIVEFRCLDDECRDLDVAPDLIRMDVDACELDVVRGAEHTLSVHRPTIIMEIHHDLLETRGQSARDIVEVLRRHRYEFFSCLNERLTPKQVFDTFDAVTNIVARPE
jgi:FkbM family methyltransferase